MMVNSQLLLAPPSPTEEHDNCQQNDGSAQGHDQCGQTEIVLVNGRYPQQRGQYQTGYKRPHDAYKDVEYQTLLPICTHEHAGHPADEAANDKPYDEVHFIFSLRVFGTHGNSVLHETVSVPLRHGEKGNIKTGTQL
jgi:hypothetical protein